MNFATWFLCAGWKGRWGALAQQAACLGKKRKGRLLVRVKVCQKICQIYATMHKVPRLEAPGQLCR